MSFSTAIMTRLDHMEAALRDALHYLKRAEEQIAHRSADIRCTTAIELQKKARQCIDRSLELIGKHE